MAKERKFKAWDRFNKKWLHDGEILVDSLGNTYWNTKEYPNKEETDTIEIILVTEVIFEGLKKRQSYYELIKSKSREDVKMPSEKYFTISDTDLKKALGL